jgi:hypothetical protein
LVIDHFASAKAKAICSPKGDRAKDDDVWILVNRIRSMAKK